MLRFEFSFTCAVCNHSTAFAVTVLLTVSPEEAALHALSKAKQVAHVVTCVICKTHTLLVDYRDCRKV